jgi:uncharacterized protein CbrC (UPF0167 family)
MARGDVEAITGALRRAAERVIKAITVNVAAELVERTPVDTGWARANWVPSVGAPHAGTVGAPEAHDMGAHEAGLGQVAAYRLDQGPTFVSNHVPYINRLNEGHSAQAPSGFVQVAIAKAVAETTADLARLGEDA